MVISFDQWRLEYPTYTFADKQSKSNDFYDVYSDQNYSNKAEVDLGLGIINGLKPITSIIELGCWKCELADYLLQNSLVEKYYAYDIEAKAIATRVCNDKRLICNVLKDEFYKTELPKADVFISTHTLEHFTNDEVIKVIDHIAGNVSAMIIEFPTLSGNWSGYNGTHILTLTMDEIENYLTVKGFKTCYIGSTVRAYIKKEIEA